jgi:hypothetical protein
MMFISFAVPGCRSNGVLDLNIANWQIDCQHAIEADREGQKL